MMGCLSRLVAAAGRGGSRWYVRHKQNYYYTRMPHFKVVFIFCPPGLCGDISLQVFSSSSSWFSWDIGCAVRWSKPPRKYIVNRIICHEWYSNMRRAKINSWFFKEPWSSIPISIFALKQVWFHTVTHTKTRIISHRRQNGLISPWCDDGNICFSTLSIRVVQSRQHIIPLRIHIINKGLSRNDVITAYLISSTPPLPPIINRHHLANTPERWRHFWTAPYERCKILQSLFLCVSSFSILPIVLHFDLLFQ